MKVTELVPAEYNPYFQTYIDKVPEDIPLEQLFELNKKEFISFLETLKSEDLVYKYAEGKWSIAELVQHIIDVERIFQYRSLSIARKDKTPLPGFDHDAYVDTSSADKRSLVDLKTEFNIVRDSTIMLYSSFSKVMLKESGIMNNATVSPQAIGFIIIGHTIHHLNILKERYAR